MVAIRNYYVDNCSPERKNTDILGLFCLRHPVKVAVGPKLRLQANIGQHRQVATIPMPVT
jgi:hypothetical protein